VSERLNVRVDCPVTGNPVELGVPMENEADFEWFKGLSGDIFVDDCIHCGETHHFTRDQTYLED
jgi:hypothetical protein